MGIRDEDVRRVREESDLVAIASQHMMLKRSGRRFMGLCPFHGEKSPSFSVNAEEGLYYCFGCGASGDTITFVREIEHLDFVGAVESLANRLGITLQYTNQVEGESRKRRKRLIETMEKAVDWYHERLLESSDAAEARSYLRGRGFDGELVREYRLGWAPDDWDALGKALDLSARDLEETGLGFINRRNRRQDAFRARILFPIFDAQGEPVALGGRIMPGAEGPKYKNSQETPIYNKSKVLYGLHWAKAAMVEADQAVVCEGYTDVIGMATAGIHRAVAPCGTALTEDHVKLLKRYATTVVLAFDSDAAGQGAAERFYEWEKAYEIEVKVAALPPGTDPGDMAREDPEALVAAVDGAVRFLQFRIERTLAAGDLTSPEGRARTAAQAVDMIAEHPDAMVRDQYLMSVADQCRVEPERLRELLAQPRTARPVPGRPTTPARGRPAEEDAAGPAPRARVSVGSGPELEAVRMRIHRPDEIADVLDDALFTNELVRAANQSLAGSAGLADAIDGADPDVADLLRRLAVEDSEADPSDVVAGLVWNAAGRAVERLEGRLRQDASDMTALSDQTRIQSLREKVQPPEPEPHALAELLRWLIEHAEEQP